MSFKKISCENINAKVICMKPISSKKMNNWKSLFPKIEVEPAVVGKNVDLSDTTKVSPLVRYQVGSKSARNSSIYAMPSVGGIGCYLSHTKCISWCRDNNQPLVVVEEDVEFSEEAIQTIRNCLTIVPNDCDYLSLMYIRQKEVNSYNNVFNRIHGGNDGAQCYVIFPSGAEKILKHCYPITTQIDLFIGIIANLYPEFKGYALKKRLYSIWDVVSDNFNTSIQDFAIKKYLPDNNSFYWVVVGVMILLIVLTIYFYKKNKSQTVI